MEGRRVVIGLVKWIVVPAALGAAGYFYVGPKLGETQVIEKVESTTEAVKRQLEEANSDDKKSPRSYER
ncbi:MAG: hypothetical protein JNJ45_00865 [Chthonomonas sp.]|nr:hypothetical protein [Chthonomonas sp.]